MIGIDPDDKWSLLLAERDALLADAMRYRWAKIILSGDDTPEANAKTLGVAAGLLAGKDIDAAIDYAMEGWAKKYG